MNNMSFKINWLSWFISIQMIWFSVVNLSCDTKIEKATTTNDYQDLIILFREFRDFQEDTNFQESRISRIQEFNN